MSAPTGSAADRVYTEIKERILSGTIPGGTLLGEADVAQDLGVSRTPVRECFIRLAAEGWMTLYPRRGALVHEIAPRDVHDVVQARILLEAGAIRTAVDEGRHEALADSMAELLEAQRAAFAADDHDAFTVADADFHHAGITSVQNALLEEFFASLKDRQRRMASHALWGEAERQASVLDEHAHLVEALRAGDVDAFDDLLRRHLGQTYGGYLSPARTAGTRRGSTDERKH